MECHLCGERHLYRQDIREHVLVKHKDQRVYQCQRCEFLSDDLREAMVEHMIDDHNIRHPLCEGVDFQHLATGELIKRMLCDAPVQNDSDVESFHSEMDNVPSPDSAVVLSTWSRETTPLESIGSPSNSEPFAESEVPERSPDSGIMSEKPSQSENSEKSDYVKFENLETISNQEKEISEDFEVGQVVWVWISGYPLWPGMIAPAPSQDPDSGKHFKFKQQSKQKRQYQFHCQFFGPTAERSWVSSRAILIWDDDTDPDVQFSYLSTRLRDQTKGSKAKNKIVTTIKSEKMKNSWNQAVSGAIEARKTFENDNEKRCEKLLYDYNKPKEPKQKTEKRKSSTKRKSLIPNSIKYKLTAYAELDYRESLSTPFDPDLHIPNELYEQKIKDIPAELVTGTEFYNYKPVPRMRPYGRKLTKESLEYALGVLRAGSKINNNSLKSPKKKGEKDSKPKRDEEWCGSKGEEIPICSICENEKENPETESDLTQCAGPCKLYFHKECAIPPAGQQLSTTNHRTAGPTVTSDSHTIDGDKVGDDVGDKMFMCNNCKTKTWPCFICKNSSTDSTDLETEIIKCDLPSCGRHYHRKCLSLHKFTNKNDKKSFKCPHHTCHTCASKALSKKVSSHEAHQSKGKMFQCIRCPSAYHVYGERGAKASTKSDIECIPAGSVLIAGRSIICPVHFQPRKKFLMHQPIHSNHCFKCFDGGTLSICDSCPAAYHSYCLTKQPSSDGAWYCENCENGVKIYYNDIVWVKMGSYRWWPSEVTHPTDIPDKLEKMRSDVGEFVVRFLGTKEYYWINQKRCFPYKGLMADPIAFNNYNNPSLYKTNGENDTTTESQINELKEKMMKSKGIQNQFKLALIEAEDLFDRQRGYKSNAGSLPFQKLSQNTYYPSFPGDLKKRIKRDLELDYGKFNLCNCHLSGENCSETTMCDNRCSQIECGTDCRVENCQNRKFTKRSYPPLQKVKTWWGGFGLEAKQKIPAGTFIIEYCGEIVDNAEAHRRLEASAQEGVTNYYILALDKDRMIDAGPRGNFARFINHSCDPNCATEPWIVNGDKRIGIFALRDIEKGVELTFNYQLKQHGTQKTKCLCHAENCAGFIGDKTATKKTTTKAKTTIKITGKMKPLSIQREESESKKRRASSSISSSSKKRKTDT